MPQHIGESRRHRRCRRREIEERARQPDAQTAQRRAAAIEARAGELAMDNGGIGDISREWSGDVEGRSERNRASHRHRTEARLEAHHAACGCGQAD